jgi:hypothetical protein
VNILFFKKHLIENSIAFMMVYVAALMMTFPSNFDVTHGSYLYLPIGAKILAFLLFGRSVLPGVIAACIFCGVFLFNAWGGNFVYGVIGAMAGAVAPLVSMWIIEKFKIANFSSLGDINFRHILFLILFTSIIHSLSRFVLYAKSGVFEISPVDFLAHYIVGDMVGGLVVIWMVLKVVPFLIATARTQPS